ncbi:Tetratricopeptide repeat protein 13 (TPR repeat protein 13) [Durusdinium trenchii]|uniref:Tetratricopeptide repeat protein 13 (TPR repeat protein 13) n=1 Tax=Durusdinium trenchii TaxID=1381693 RepID=A0ABP0QRF7_9DINO
MSGYPLVPEKMQKMRKLAEAMAQEEEEENKMFETPEDRALADLLAAYSHAAERSGFGDFQEAVEAWSKVLQLEESFQAYQERGSALAILERFEEAEADFGEERSSVYFSRGSARGDAGREAEAIEDFGEALKLEPERLEAWLSRGTAYLALGKLDNASSDAEAALKLQRDSGAAWGLLGAIRQRQSLFREAVDACQMALKLEPTLSWAERCLEASLAELEQEQREADSDD